jgi:uncharacterized protein with FMN-binding domain
VATHKSSPGSDTPRAPLSRNNLTAIGSAAVIVVYAAGFARTQPAAQRFADEARPIRRPATDESLSSRHPAAEPTPVRRDPAADSATVTTGHSATPAPVTKAAAPIAKRSARHTTTATPSDSVPMNAAPVSNAPLTAALTAPSIPPVQTPASPTTAPADSAPTPEKPTYKDGTYSAWGTSRHGDIQATVTVRNSKIIYASITECLTQYSCSWVAPLPPQVVQRQNAEVDFVSGATQSSNAFYYAVLGALKQAK